MFTILSFTDLNSFVELLSFLLKEKLTEQQVHAAQNQLKKQGNMIQALPMKIAET